jgi:hypothetical protein
LNDKNHIAVSGHSSENKKKEDKVQQYEYVRYHGLKNNLPNPKVPGSRSSCHPRPADLFNANGQVGGHGDGLKEKRKDRKGMLDT